MIKFSCPHCGKTISAPDDYAGKKGKCPGCKSVVLIEDPDVLTDVDVIEDVQVVEEEAPPPAKKAAPRAKPASAIREGGAAGKPRRAVVADDEDDDEDVPEAEEVADDEEEEDRPRKKKKKRRRWRGEWADCPNCNSPGDATRLYYTWWGGFIGPLVISHVRCNQCGYAYNGKTGKDNTIAIVLWVVLPLALVFGALAFFGVLGALFK